MTQIYSELVPEINHSLEIQLPLTTTGDELREKLASHVNELINHDFEKLVFNLYRIDVNEARMRALLAQKDGENAAALIADLIIERQLLKIKSRQQFRQRDNRKVPFLTGLRHNQIVLLFQMQPLLRA